MVPWNSLLGASRALPTRATLPGFPFIDEASPLPPAPSSTFLQRRWKIWKYTWIFINIEALLDLFGFLAFIISDYYLFPWELKRRRRVAMIARRRNEPLPLPTLRRALSLTSLDLSQNYLSPVKLDSRYTLTSLETIFSISPSSQKDSASSQLPKTPLLQRQSPLIIILPPGARVLFDDFGSIRDKFLYCWYASRKL